MRGVALAASCAAMLCAIFNTSLPKKDPCRSLQNPRPATIAMGPDLRTIAWA